MRENLSKKEDRKGKIKSYKIPFLKLLHKKIEKPPAEKTPPPISAFDTRLPLSLDRDNYENIKPVAVEEEVSKKVQTHYTLPLKYGSNRIVLLPRDPWWIYTYWDISAQRIDEVINSIPANERDNLRWALRVYDVTGIDDFRGDNAHAFFDIDVSFDAGNWYININNLERSWCVEIGFKNAAGKFFVVARSNIVKTPYFGISSSIDEEWALPDEDYFKVLGVYDLGKSSLEMKKRFEEIVKSEISSAMASWGVSSFAGKKQEQDKFFLEVATELILYGRTEPDAEVTVEGKKIKLRNDGTFSLRYNLPVGDFTFEVVGTSRNKKYVIKKVPAVKRYDK